MPNNEEKKWRAYKKAGFTPLDFPEFPTENLVFALDGLYNVKGGHSSTATQWLDLCTGEYSDFPINPENWTDRGYRMTGDTEYSLRKYLINASTKHAVHIVFEELDETSTGPIIAAKQNDPANKLYTTSNICATQPLSGYARNQVINMLPSNTYSSQACRSVIFYYSKSYKSTYASYKYSCYQTISSENNNHLTYDPGAASRGNSYATSNPSEITVGYSPSKIYKLTDAGYTHGNNIIINSIRIYSGSTIPFTLADAHKSLLERFPNR